MCTHGSYRGNIESFEKGLKKIKLMAISLFFFGFIILCVVATIKYFTWGKRELYANGKCSVEYVFSRLDVEQQDDFAFSNEKLLANALEKTNKRCVFFIGLAEESAFTLTMCALGTMYTGGALLFELRKIRSAIKDNPLKDAAT